MKTALIAYGTNSGNTYMISRCIAEGLEANGYEVVVMNIKEVSVKAFSKFDLIVFGSSSWKVNEEEGMLQPDMYNFVENNKDLNLKNKSVAVFGVGHHSYTRTAMAGDRLREYVESCKGKLIGEVFKVDDVVDLFFDKAYEWGNSLS